MSVERMPFGATKDGSAVEKFLLKAGQLEAEVITYGATLTALRVPDKDGKTVDVVLGYRSVAGYEENGGYLGATVGRYANRIGGAAFTIDGVRYQLTANEGRNQLHGGPGGYAHQVFRGEPTGESQVTFSFRDPDGANGYPGNVEMSVTYTLTEEGLRLSYRGETDKPTFCNFTNHSYFNLNGGGSAMGHLLWIKSDTFTPVDADSIPVEQSRPVEGTAFDFRQEKPVGRDIEADEEQLHRTGGYDHNFLLGSAEAPRLVARLTGEKSGIVMETYTCQSGVQLYAANWLEAERDTKSGIPYGKREAVCLETQIPPDSPNHPEWGDVVLRPGQIYESVTEYRFNVKEA